MKAFVDKYEDRIHGVLSCFDRMLFRGNLPIMSGWSMAQLLQAHEIDCRGVKPFLLANAERVKACAVTMAREHGRPFEYLGVRVQMADDNCLGQAAKMVDAGHADLAPAAGPGLPQRPRVAGPQADGARSRTRQDRLASSSVSATCRVRSAWPIASRT